MAHTKAQKDKVRKSGLSLQNKTKDLGRYCDVFSALAYWNPTHERMETVMHVPRGQRVPDLNRIVRPQSRLPFRRVYPALLLIAAVSTISRVPCETSHGRATRSIHQDQRVTRNTTRQ